MKAAIGIVLLLLSSFQSYPNESPKSITRITLESAWGGLASHRSYNATIDAKHNWQLDGHQVPNADIARLLTALQDNVASTTPHALGLDVLLSAEKIEPGPFCESSRPAVARFVDELLRSADSQQDYVKTHYPTGHGYLRTDDYPYEAVVVSFRDGSSIRAVSRSQQPFMLPFKVNGIDSYNVELPRAIIGIFGSHDANEARLAGKPLLGEYVETTCGDNRERIEAKALSTDLAGFSDWMKRRGYVVETTFVAAGEENRVLFSSPRWTHLTRFDIASKAAGLSPLQSKIETATRTLDEGYDHPIFGKAAAEAKTIYCTSPPDFEIRDDLFRNYRPELWERLEPNVSSDVLCDMNASEQGGDSVWLLLANGDVVLVSAYPTAPLGGYRIENVDRSWPQYPNSPENKQRFFGIVLPAKAVTP